MDEENKVRRLIESPVKELGYEVVSVNYGLEKGGGRLEIVVDRAEPISLDDIVKISDAIGPLLDSADPIASGYTLDISSLGAEKPIDPQRLDHYLKRYVSLHLSRPYKGKNILEGEIETIVDGALTLSYMNKARKEKATFPLKDVDKARLAIKF